MPMVRVSNGGTGELIHLQQSTGRLYTGAFFDYTFDLSGYDVADKSASDFITLLTVNIYVSSPGNFAPSAQIKSFDASTKTLVVSAGISGMGTGNDSAYRTIHLFFAN